MFTSDYIISFYFHNRLLTQSYTYEQICCGPLTHWGRVTHICVSNLTIIVSDNGLTPGRRQAIIWTNAGILLIGPLGTNFSEISIRIHNFSFTKMHLKMSSAKWRPLCLGLNVLTEIAHPRNRQYFHAHLPDMPMFLCGRRKKIIP